MMDKSIICKWVTWSYNFDYFKLDEMFNYMADGNEMLTAHIKGIFERDLQCCGRSGVANQFFCDIDTELQDRFIEWIDLDNAVVPASENSL